MTLKELKKSGKLIDCEQGTDEWFVARLGMVTASEFKSATAKGQGKTRHSYMCKLLAERTTGEPSDNGYSNKSMDWGKEYESSARAVYTLETGHETVEVGFIKYDDNIGCSPDSLVGDDGLIQIKCPDSHTHISYILNNKVPSNYMKQIQGELWVTDRLWSDFWSYDPRNKSRDNLLIRVYRDESFINILKTDIQIFVNDLIANEKYLNGK